MRLSLIVAVAANGVIGRGNALPWRLPADLVRFKRLTMGHHLIVGRRTWESIGRPLPGRRTIVLSRAAPALPPGVRHAASLEEALEIAAAAGDDEAFVAGGAAVYARALPRADRIYWTEVHADVEGEVRFPPFEKSRWAETERVAGTVDERNPLPHAFVVYDRAPGG
ncbi:MAG: dihydrofolate reductase [Acidobacteriota bacterium]|nr:dihydrofolate reductase [Acidobacteriota bacterium]MDH3524696.1 dihydrofolate reductase [Acidobacteriota bacterium]